MRIRPPIVERATRPFLPSPTTHGRVARVTNRPDHLRANDNRPAPIVERATRPFLPSPTTHGRVARATNRLNYLPRTLALLLLLSACQSAPKVPPSNEPQNLVWPDPPNESRIAYVQSVQQPSDLGIRRTGIGRFFQRLLGTGRKEFLVKPFGIALDEFGNLCITDTGNNTVVFYDRVRKKWQRWESIEDRPFISPIAIAKTNGVLFVADPGRGEVIAFTLNGKLRWIARDQLDHPAGLAIAAGNLFVADAHAHRVVVFDLAGKFLSSFGRRGKEPGEFNFPTHVATDAAGNIWVTDSINCRLQCFDTAGKFKAELGSPGDVAGYFSRPKGVAVDSGGRVYAVDANFDNFQIFDPQGRVLLNIGAAGNGPGEFWLPNGIAISRDNEIFVTDGYNHRLQVFRYVGTP